MSIARKRPDGPRWKENWPRVREHYIQWWNREGCVLTISGLPPLNPPRDTVVMPPMPGTPRERQTDPDWMALSQRFELAQQRFPADNLPMSFVELGCAQLAACFGAEPEFDSNTVWYADCIEDPDKAPPLVLTKTEKWWRIYKRILLRLLEVSRGDFFVGMPSFASNLDVLAELRGTQNLLFDLIDRGDWVKEKLEEINQAFFVAYDDYYEHIRLSDGSSAHGFFYLWGPGKVSLLQCDFAAMISPDMFADFVVPPLLRQCAWLDHSLFHLDGPACIGHLDHLLAIPELDAIQWMPGVGQPGAGDPTWDALYRRIRDADKSVQILGASVDQAIRILDTFGPAGVYVSVRVASEAEAECMQAYVETLRRG